VPKKITTVFIYIKLSASSKSEATGHEN
jgi:hypothetical protein